MSSEGGHRANEARAAEGGALGEAGGGAPEEAEGGALGEADGGAPEAAEGGAPGEAGGSAPEGAEGGAARRERRRISLTDPKAMRALAHPVRLALLEAIGRAEGQTLTATQASEITGESPANCAFHLRTLAKYGLIEEAGGGRGRQRPWRQAYDVLEMEPPWHDPQTRLAAEALGLLWFEQWVGRARQRLLRLSAYPDRWQESLVASQYDAYITADEARQLQEKISGLLEPYRDRLHDPSLRPAGSERFELLTFGYPLTDPASEE